MTDRFNPDIQRTCQGKFFPQNGEPQEIKDIVVIDGYAPYLKDEFYRNKELPEDEYHFISRGKYADLMAANLDLSFLRLNGEPQAKEQIKATEEISEEPEDVLARSKNSSNARNPQIQRVVVKRYNLKELEGTIDGFTRIRRETQVCRINNHENIVKFYEIFMEPGLGGSEPSHIWLVSERMDHTLEKYYEHLEKKRNESSKFKVDIRHLGALLCQVLRALDYLHQRGIMHRDITPRSIGMNQKEFIIKLLDFGLCREISPNLDHSTNVETPFIYKSIEVLMRGKYNTKVDIWSTALVALEMLGYRLFMPTGTDQEIAQKIRRRGAENAMKDRIFEVLGVPDDRYGSIFGRSVAEPPGPGKLNDILYNLKTERIGDDVGPLKSIEFIDLIKKMLDPNMKSRLSADESLKHIFLRILNEKYEQKSKDKQPQTDREFEKRNQNDRKILFKEIRAGYTKLCSQFEDQE